MSGSAPDPGVLRLAPGEVHVWCAALDLPAETAARLQATLSPDERQRSARFRRKRDRRRFAAAHGVLRDLLGRYLETPAERIGYAYNAYGKPTLGAEFAGRLEFNLAHSAGRALIAIAAEASVGVDLECLRAHADYPEIARQFFSPAEIEQLERLPPPLFAPAFIACWTKKEAYLKARGEGLAVPLRGFSVPLVGDPASGPRDSEDQPSGPAWSFHTLHPAPGYIGALVVAGGGWRLSQRQWRAGRG